jgi:hypothetical protein
LLIVTLHLLSASALADDSGAIRGSFSLDLTLEPQTSSRQWTEFDLDLEALLRLDLPLDGLTIHNDLALGIAGFEHDILAFDATVSPLILHDELWFATPYNSSGERLTDRSRFVENRLKASLELDILDFDLLALLEDIHFNHPYPEPLQPPEYGFGLSLGLGWNMPEGPRLLMKTDICLEDAVSRVKGYSALGKVCQGGGFAFTSETIELTGLELGEPFSLDSRLTFRRDQPLRGLFGLRAALSPELEARLIFTSEDLAPLIPLPFPSLVISSLTALYTLTFQLPGQEQFILALTDQNGDLFPSDGDPLLAYAAIGLQESKIRLMVLAKLRQGLQYGLLGINLPLPKMAGYLNTEVDFNRDDEVLEISSWSFEFLVTITRLELRSKIRLELKGLEAMEFGLSLAF